MEGWPDKGYLCQHTLLPRFITYFYFSVQNLGWDPWLLLFLLKVLYLQSPHSIKPSAKKMIIDCRLVGYCGKLHILFAGSKRVDEWHSPWIHWRKNITNAKNLLLIELVFQTDHLSRPLWCKTVTDATKITGNVNNQIWIYRWLKNNLFFHMSYIRT